MNEWKQVQIVVMETAPDYKPLCYLLHQEYISMIDESGAFKDRGLEAEYQEWKKKNAAGVGGQAAEGVTPQYHNDRRSIA